ncbi:MAG: hypothetical protein IT204_26235, partial [Fimbriimonadaceae bacterium]|nr:hypothetical protein [Fimbriimonadaceae bacterium]
SPEQGRGASLDRRSDIYSLGIILYELATGRVPFSAETPVAVIYKHAHDPLPPVERLNPRLPPALVRILYKALAKNPEDRFATAGEMANALEACRAALGWDKTEVEPIPAPLPKPAPGPTPPPSQGPAPKPRLALAGFGGVALLASVLGLLGVCGMLAVLPRLFGTMASPDASPTAVHTRPAVGGTRTPAPAATASPAPPTATRTAAPTSTRLAPTATRTPASTATSSLPGPAPRLMFRDDFQSTSSGWETSRTSSRVLGYGNGVYVFEIFESGIRPHTLAPAGEITNAQIAVTVRSLKAGTVPWLGVVCNRQASGAYYYLGFRPDGYYSISYFDGEDRHVLTSERDALELSDAIQKNAEAYRLEAECGSNGRLRLVVDGAEIAAAGDITHTSGEVGLSAASYADVPVEVHFDDLVVRGAPPPVVLLRDDFEDATSGWDSSSSEQRSVAYRDGRYVIEIHTPKLRVWGSQRAETLSNVRVAVTVRDAGATGTGRFGVVCHRQSSGAHYFLGVDGEGDYIIGFFDGEASEQLRGGRYARLGAADTRRVEAECAADGTLRLLVDGVQIASAAHDTYTSGQIGLFASSDEEVPVEIHFDDLLVTELE